MKNQIIIGRILLFNLLMLICSFTPIKPIDCKEINEKSLYFIEQYKQDKRKEDLDSALFYTHEGLKYCKTKLFSTRKLVLFSLQHHYSEGIKYIASLKDNDFSPFYRKTLTLRFKIMKAIYEQNRAERDKYLNQCVFLLESFLKENSSDVKTLLCQSDFKIILKNPLSTIIVQYYYYRSLGTMFIKQKIVSEIMGHKYMHGMFQSYLVQLLEQNIMDFSWF